MTKLPMCLIPKLKLGLNAFSLSVQFRTINNKGVPKIPNQTFKLICFELLITKTEFKGGYQVQPFKY